MKRTPTIEVKSAKNAEEYEILADILSRALFFPPLAQYDWISNEGPENLRIVRENGQIRGGLSLHKMGQWFGGVCLPTGAVRCVGIAPEARCRGLATYLLQGCLQEMYERKIPLSTLYPATQPVYRRAGYEQGGSRIYYTMPLHAVTSRERQLHLEPHPLSELSLLEELYTQHARRTSGHLQRNTWAWNRLQRPTSAQQPTQCLVAYDDQQPVGYIIYCTKPPTPGERFAGEIHIKDWVSLTPQATDALWTFLADQRTVNDTVRWNGAPNDPKLLRIANQHHEVTMQMIWMLRLVDVGAAFEQRIYPPWLNAELHLDIVDPACSWNHGTWIVSLSQGQAHMKRGGQGHLKLPVQLLASLYSGFLTAAEAKNAYPIEGDEESLRLLCTAFSGPSPWMPDMF